MKTHRCGSEMIGNFKMVTTGQVQGPPLESTVFSVSAHEAGPTPETVAHTMGTRHLPWEATCS